MSINSGRKPCPARRCPSQGGERLSTEDSISCTALSTANFHVLLTSGGLEQTRPKTKHLQTANGQLVLMEKVVLCLEKVHM